VAADDPDTSGDVCVLNPKEYPGGIAIWGAVPPVYDTSRYSLDRGIHVHARKVPNGSKDIDRTYRNLRVAVETDLLTKLDLEVGEQEAIYHMVSRVFGKELKYVECTHCKHPHLDRDWFAVHPHKKHLCHGCGKKFSDDELGIGNPTHILRSFIEGSSKRTEVCSLATLDIAQANYPGGIRIWGSNPAIAWTAEKPEESGIHVHAIGADGQCVEDGTYKNVIIDNVKLDEDVIRYAMAYSAMPHISDRVVSFQCPDCGEYHLDRGELAFTPHEIHECESCSTNFRAPGSLKLTIGNPMQYFCEQLAKNAVRAPQTHKLGLRPETI
jgi:predicted RNA-binding Zn-ribbon protein involved in translation (DUF1610 family)